jgi:hypothetical protein
MKQDKQIDNLNTLLENSTAKKAASPDTAFSTFLENTLKFEFEKTYKRKCENNRLICFFTFPRLVFSSLFALIMIIGVIVSTSYKSDKMYMALAQKELEEVSSQIASIEEDLDEYQKIIEAIDTDLDIKLEDL